MKLLLIVLLALSACAPVSLPEPVCIVRDGAQIREVPCPLGPAGMSTEQKQQ